MQPPSPPRQSPTCGNHLSQLQVPTSTSRLHSPPPPNQLRVRILSNLRRGRPLLALTSGVRSSGPQTNIASSENPPPPGYSRSPSVTLTPGRAAVGNPAQPAILSTPVSDLCDGLQEHVQEHRQQHLQFLGEPPRTDSLSIQSNKYMT